MPFWSRYKQTKPEWAAKLSAADQRSLTAAIEELLASHAVAFEWIDVGLRLEIPEGAHTIAALERLANLYRTATAVERIILVEQHFRPALAPAKRPDRWEDAQALVKPGLRPRSAVDGKPWAADVTRVLADDLIAVLILDLGDERVWISPEQLAGWRISASDAWETALRNVLSERLIDDKRTILPSGGEIRALFGASVFGASRAIELDRYFEVPSPLGALVSVPAQNVVIFHLIGIPESCVRARQFLASIGAELFSTEEDDPLSPHTYWWREGTWTPITSAGEDRVMRDIAPDELLAFEAQAGAAGPG